MNRRCNWISAFAFFALVSLISVLAAAEPEPVAPAMSNIKTLSDEEWHSTISQISERLRQESLPQTLTKYAKAEHWSRVFKSSFVNVYDTGISNTQDLWLRLVDGSIIDVAISGALDTTRPVPAHPLRASFRPHGLGSRYFSTGATHTFPDSNKAFAGYVDNLGEDALGPIESALKKNGYDVKSSKAANLTVLREAAQNVGAFWLSTHGFSGPVSDYPGGPTYMTYKLATNDIVGAKCDLPEAECRANRADRDAGLVSIKMNELGVTRIFINGRFIERYWKFATNAIVFLDGCESTKPGPEIQLMVDALKKNGAGYLLGWTDLVSKGYSAETAAWIFDRLLGANEFKPLTPRSRPFSVNELFAYLQQTGKDKDPDGNSRLTLQVFHPNTAGNLLPSIRNMMVDEAEKTLSIYGEFGEKRDSVTINSQSVSVSYWDNKKLKVDLPLTGPAASGPVQVQVGKHKSQLAPLTEWVGTFKGRHIYNDMFGIPGPWMEMNCSKVRVRADLRKWRLTPEEEAVAGSGDERNERFHKIITSNATPDSECQQSAGGLGVKDMGGVKQHTEFASIQNEKVSWADDENTPEKNWWFLRGYIDAKTMKWHPNFDSRGTKAVKVTQKFIGIPAPPNVFDFSEISVGQIGYAMQNEGYPLSPSLTFGPFSRDLKLGVVGSPGFKDKGTFEMQMMPLNGTTPTDDHGG